MPKGLIVEKYVILAMRYFLGAHILISGLNHYLLVFPDPIPLGPDATGRFMKVLVESGLYDASRVVEIAVGLALLLGLWVPLSLILLVPVTVMIFWVSVFVTGSPRTVFTGWRTLILNFVLLAAYFGYFKTIFFRPVLPLRPAWRERWAADQELR